MNEAKSLDQALAEAFSKADHLQAPLDQRLKLYLGESRKLLPEMEATYDQLVARIAANIEDSNQIPGVGEVLPDFCMTDSEGQLVELATLSRRGRSSSASIAGPGATIAGSSCIRLPAPIRRSWRPGGDVISIVPETASMRRALQAARGVPFRVLTDIDLGYALNLGLIFWVGDTVMRMYRGFGIDLARFQGHSGWLLPIPATLVVGQDGRLKARCRPGLPPPHAHGRHSAGAAGGSARQSSGHCRFRRPCRERRKGRDNGQFA